MGFGELGALHYVLYPGYTTPGLCATVPQSSGAGDVYVYTHTHTFDYIDDHTGLWKHVLCFVAFVSGREGSHRGYDEISAIL